VTITTLAQHARDLADAKISSVELTQDYLQRIADSNHNAFISVDEQMSLTEAAAADERRANGDKSTLLGVVQKC
jgi:aspartyl-tRNA(Asn)/glutamyl-tRNA(Gln) amidotransferase subunit A